MIILLIWTDTPKSNSSSCSCMRVMGPRQYAIMNISWPRVVDKRNFAAMLPIRKRVCIANHTVIHLQFRESVVKWRQNLTKNADQSSEYLYVFTKWFSVSFYRTTRMHSADYAVARCLSVCLSVRLSVTRRYCV